MRIGMIGWGRYSGLCRLGKFFPCFSATVAPFCGYIVVMLYFCPSLFVSAIQVQIFHFFNPSDPKIFIAIFIYTILPSWPLCWFLSRCPLSFNSNIFFLNFSSFQLSLCFLHLFLTYFDLSSFLDIDHPLLVELLFDIEVISVGKVVMFKHYFWILMLLVHLLPTGQQIFQGSGQSLLLLQKNLVFSLALLYLENIAFVLLPPSLHSSQLSLPACSNTLKLAKIKSQQTAE